MEKQFIITELISLADLIGRNKKDWIEHKRERFKYASYWVRNLDEEKTLYIKSLEEFKDWEGMPLLSMENMAFSVRDPFEFWFDPKGESIKIGILIV
ncbi:MAG: hypothetical protein LBG59_08965 [Candidatus Peribacteria bacterium]|jgi:hypothetical protein|nr:hypothetical protein [Candidatus Peribacteria bacterium]